MKEFIYTGRLEGNTSPGRNGSDVFKGYAGQLPLYLFGRNAAAAKELIGQPVIVTGTIESSVSESGRQFLNPRPMRIAPAAPDADENIVAVHGTVSSLRTFGKSGQETLIEVEGTRYDKETSKSVKTTYKLPIVTEGVSNSDIGAPISVTASLDVQQGRFVNLKAKSVWVGGVAHEDAAEDSTSFDDI